MKPSILRTTLKHALLTSCVSLSACCGICTKCPADAECAVIPSNAATGIKSSAGREAPTADAHHPGVPEVPLPDGWRTSYPLFEGDYFSVTLPVGVREDPAKVVKTIVTHMGFADPTGLDVLAPEFFHVDPFEVNIGGGDLLRVAQVNCATQPQTDPGGSVSFCKLNEGQRKQLIQKATGLEADHYLNRRLTRHYFYQRPQHRKWPTDRRPTDKLCVPDPVSPNDCIDVFIEHVVIAASVRRDGTVASVSGRVFSNYKVTNEPKLKATDAIKKAYGYLWKIPGISRTGNQPEAAQEPPLVLLPFAHTAGFDLGRLRSFRWPSYRTPQLRYAYRTTLFGDIERNGQRVDAVSWRAWVDAETGDILQLIPLFAFSGGVPVKGKGWRLHPSYPISSVCPDPGSDDCPTMRTFHVDDAAQDEAYCLKLAEVFDQLEFYDSLGTLPYLCSESDNFAEGLDCEKPWDCLCRTTGDHRAIAYLHMNAYAQVDAYKEKLDAAICHPTDQEPICDGGVFQAAKDIASGSYVPVRVKVSNDLSMGSYVRPAPAPHLTFGEVGTVFMNEQWCTSSQPYPDAGLRPGAQDATLMTHEFAHLVMDGLLAGRPDDWCGQSACPVPLPSDIVHDMADGLSSVSNGTNWFGAWWGNDDQANHSELDGPIRELDYDFDADHFPEHRDWSRWFSSANEVTFIKKEYADGQIAAAALWGVTESMNRWLETLGPAAFETTLLNVLPNHFFPNACGAFTQGDTCDYPDDCDLDVYRYLHLLLADLIANDMATGVTVTSNKLAAGFARAGIFLVPARCIGASTGADPADSADSYCPSQPYGGDAVIDVTDDWLNHGSSTVPAQIPEFEVWTGPQFRFQGDKAQVVTTPDLPPCNRYYRISIANNPEFEFVEDDHKLSKESAWLDAGGNCRVRWSPGTDDGWLSFWQDVAATSREHGLSNAYYRVETGTSNAVDALPTSSSEYPGKPHWDALDQPAGPPYAVLNDTGAQEF